MKGGVFGQYRRGPVVREGDLVDALRKGHLAGTALDVYENEPNVHPKLIGVSNVITTPHIANTTYEGKRWCRRRFPRYWIF